MAAFASIEKQAAKFGATLLRNERGITTAVVRETAKQHDAHVKAYEKANQAEAKALLKSVAQNKKLADAKIKEVERAAKQGVRAEERAAKESERVAERHAQANLRIRQKHFRDVQRAQETAANQAARTEAAAAKASDQSRRGIARTIGGSVTRSASGILGGAGMVAGGIMAVGGGFSAVDSVQTSISNRGRASDIAIASGGELTKGDVYSRASNTATAYGTTTEKALSATDRIYAKSGNAKLALEMMPKVLALATATGGDAGEIGEVAGQISNADKTLSSKQVDDVLRGWGGQGRAGSVDMRELAQYGSRLAAGAGTFGGDKAANMVKLGGLTQIATAGGASSAAEATEAVAHLGTDVYKNKADFAAKGINPLDKYGKVIDPEELVKRSVIATKGNRGELQKMFGLQSIKAVSGAGNIFQDAYVKSRDAGGSEKDSMAAGTKAMNAAFETFSKAALTEEQVRKDAASRLQDTDKKLEAAMNQLREAVADKLLPKFEELLPKITKLIPDLADLAEKLVALAEWIGKNPFKSIVLAISAAVVRDVAMAGIGKAIVAAIASASGGGGVAGAATSAAGGAAKGGGMRNLAAAGAIGAIAVAVGSAGVAAIDASFAATDRSHAKTFANEMATNNMGSEASRMGGSTPEALKKKKAALEAAQKSAGETIAMKKKEQEDYNSFFSLQRDLGQITSVFGSDAAETKEKAENASMARAKKEFDELTEKLKAVNSSLELMSKNAGNADLKQPKSGQPLSSPDRSKG